MAIKASEISGAELEIMQILWDSDKPMKIQEICDSDSRGARNYSTVATLLGRMKEKGAVHAEKIGKTYYYSPLIDREKYKKKQTKNLVQKLYNGSVKELAAALFKDSGLKKSDFDEIRAMIDERER